MNILIPDVLSPPANIEKEIFGSTVEIIVAEATFAGQISDDTWRRCDAILAWDQIQYTSELIDKLENCKAIVRVGVGYDNIDLKAAAQKNIPVCTVPDYGTEEVADHTMALMLALVRGFPVYVKRVRQRDWNRENKMPFRLRGKTMGIVGLGRIGSAVAVRAKAFGMNVVFYDPYKEDGYDKSLGIQRVENLDDIGQQSDIISLHTPLTNETKGMIDKRFFSNTTRNPILINTARGAIIKLDDLYTAMQTDTINAVGLDVLPIEPNDDTQELIMAWEQKETWLQGRVLVTPHVAFYSPEGYREMRQKAAREALRVLNGESPRNPVTVFNSCQK